MTCAASRLSTVVRATRAVRVMMVLGALVQTGCRDTRSAPPDPLEIVERVDERERHAPAPDVVVAHGAVPPSQVPPEHDEARELDSEYANDSMIVVRRFVYRFSLRLRGSLGGGTDTVPEPTAELRVDVAPDRLRARF